ncbi:MAG: ATP-binding protein [Clostridia bacterium]|nr:ATP-binding protein [Clostridia bacterium]
MFRKKQKNLTFRNIKVITGIRRSGKSKLLEELKRYIIDTIENNNIIHINYNLPKFEKLKNYNALIEHIESNYKEEKENFILIDEVQMCDNFEKAINGFHAEEKYDIYITGSNAFLMSSDLATLFTGRTFNIEIYPFSFKEFQEYYNYKDIQEAFEKYVYEGGMSGSYLYKTQEEKLQYIKEVFNTLIVKDIKQKYKIRNTNIIQNLTDFLMDNISNLTSSNNITHILNSNNVSITDKTVNNYIEYLCNAFAFYKIKRYDIKGKKFLSTQNKYYLADQSFRYATLGTNRLDYGRIYENIVAIELLRRGYEVYVGTLYKKEIDFVAQKQGKKVYIQVADDITNEKTFKREIESLLKIQDAYPKMIIARTKHDTYQYEGITIEDIAIWLSKEDEYIKKP